MRAQDIDPKMMSSQSLYEMDFYAWTQEQAALLHEHKWSQLDLPNLIEEIAALGKQQRQELRNRLSILIGHLLKWGHLNVLGNSTFGSPPERRSRSWLTTIRVQRLDISELLEENPSLKPYLEEALQKTYSRGMALAIGETDLPDCTFPQMCPYSLTEILSDRFYPSKPAIEF